MSQPVKYAHPADVAQWRCGDVMRTGGKEWIVTWVGSATVELAPATWWRRVYWWARSAPLSDARASQLGGALSGAVIGATLGGLPGAVCCLLIGGAVGLWWIR